MSVAFPRRMVLMLLSDVGRWPLYLASAGLGSKVSTCDGPPFMNRKITRLALGAKSGCFDGSGSDVASSSPASPSTPARPNVPKPVPTRRSISRRVIGSCIGVLPLFSRSVDESKFIGAQQYLCVAFPLAEGL